MSAIEQPRPAATPTRLAAPGNVLAVLDGTLDDGVVTLALALARESAVLVDLLLLVEVPIGLPMASYGEWLLAHNCSASLLAAEQLCGTLLGDSAVQLCRSIGPALMDEVRARQASSLVIGAPARGWWTQRRGRRGIAYAQARSGCRVYVLGMPARPAAYPAPRWRHIFG